MNPTMLEYAMMAGAAYESTRSDFNKLPRPSGWQPLDQPRQLHHRTNGNSGFEAVAFIRDRDIVISYAGTYEKDRLGDGVADLSLGSGLLHPQALEAARYYMDIKQHYPTDQYSISFTGHSLGGGLASLMAVYFDQPAVTFDQAPFRAAVSNTNATSLLGILAATGYGLDSALATFFVPPLFDPTQPVPPTPLLVPRAHRVQDISVEGEILSYLPLKTIGTGRESIAHGATTASSINLHSQALLIAFKHSETFRQATYQLPFLGRDIFDSSLFGRDTDTSDLDFLTHLIRREFGVPGEPGSDQDLLTKFAADMMKLGVFGLAEDAVRQPLAQIAMQHYYQSASGVAHEFFAKVNGGLQFDLTQPLGDSATPIGQVQSYDQLKDWILANVPTDASGSVYPEIASFLADARRITLPLYRSIEATAPGDETSDFMLAGTAGGTLAGGGGDDMLVGGSGVNQLDGGDGADSLIGGSRADTLIGGTGDDVLQGGAGRDVYVYRVGDGNDKIIDADGGVIRLEGQDYELFATGLFTKQAGQDIWTAAVGGQTLTLSHTVPWSLTLDGGASIDLGEDFDPENFRMTLVEDGQRDFDATRTILGDLAPVDFDPEKDGVQIKQDELSNIITDPGSPDPDRPDYLHDSGGDDLIQSGGGDDIVWAENGGKNRIELGAGNDYGIGLGQGDLIEGGDGADVMVGAAGDDRFFADTERTLDEALAQQNATPSGQKGDFFDGGAGDDTLIGGVGNDFFGGGAGDDLVVAGAGDDDIWSDLDAWYIGQDWTAERSVTTYADGSKNYYTTFSFYAEHPDGGDDVVYAGAGTDWVTAGDGADYVDGGLGDDVLFGEGGSDDLLGGAGNDEMIGDSSSTPVAAQGDDYLDGGDGDDKLWGFGGGDVLFGGSGNDVVFGDQSLEGAGSDYLDGGAGDDTLLGAAASDTLFGGDGNDFLQGDSGDGLGDGDDYLDGEAGADTLFGEGGDDELHGGADADVLAGGSGRDLLFGDAGNDQIAGDEGNSSTEGDADQIYGGAGDDLIDAQGGDDVASGGDGNDLISGRLGNDTLMGDAGNDQLQGGAGDDTLDGGGDSDTLFGEAGNDTLIGGDGNDYLLGGFGDDTLDGGQGNDVYYYTGGDGRDHIVDSGGTDWLVFTDFNLGQITVGVGSLKLTLPDGGEVHLDDFDPVNPLAGSIEYFQFADGTVKTRQQVIQALGFKIEGTPGDDVLSGTTWSESIRAHAGNDQVFGLGGNDSIDLGDGADLADAGDGDDLVLAGEGDDAVVGGKGADQLDGGGGHDMLFGNAGDDLLTGGLGDDLLGGGAGNDRLLGGEGNDRYRFGVGAGVDLVTDALGTNAVELDGGLAVEQVAFRRLDDDLIVTVSGTSDQLTVQDWFAASGTGWTVAFDDGTVLDRLAVDERLLQNQAPVLGVDAVTAVEDGLALVGGNVLANDGDPEGRALRVINAGTQVGAYGTLSLAPDGGFAYTLDNGAVAVQSLAAGQTVSDSFVYTATDDDPAGAMTATSSIVVSVVGANDAPVAQTDAAAVGEDAVLVATGNVLANDHDIDNGTTLGVMAPGVTTTSYGRLSLETAGGYVYVLDNDGAAVQGLGRGQQVTERFAYQAFDGLASASASLEVTITGANDAPLLAVPLADQVAAPNKSWIWQVADGTFADPDQGDALAYSATLADGSPLPGWLAFDAATLTFSGRVPRTATGSLDIQLTATDRVGASGSTVGSLATSDIFRLDFDGGAGGGGGGHGGGGSQGNEGVGNGVDGPPPGHNESFNDGPGTAPGRPGAAGGDGLGEAQSALASVPGPMPVMHDLLVTAPGLSKASAAPGQTRRAAGDEPAASRAQQSTPAMPAAASMEPVASAAAAVAVPTAGAVEQAAVELAGTHPPTAADLGPLLAGWGQAPARPAYLNSRHWQEASAPWTQQSSASNDGAFAAWLAMDLALAEAQRSRKTGAWTDTGAGNDLSALSGLRAGYLGSRLAFREDAFSLLAGSGQALNVFDGLGQGAQKIA